MVLDYKLFKPGRPLRDNLLWVLEQLPGVTQAADVTDVLRKQGREEGWTGERRVAEKAL